MCRRDWRWSVTPAWATARPSHLATVRPAQARSEQYRPVVPAQRYRIPPRTMPNDHKHTDNCADHGTERCQDSLGSCPCCSFMYCCSHFLLVFFFTFADSFAHLMANSYADTMANFICNVRLKEPSFSCFIFHIQYIVCVRHCTQPSGHFPICICMILYKKKKMKTTESNLFKANWIGQKSMSHW